MGKENFQAGQLIPTSSTPPGNAGFYRIDKDTIGVVGNLVQKNANTNVESNVSTGANLAAELAALPPRHGDCFVIGGQSNADGRGIIDGDVSTPVPNVVMLDKGEAARLATEPVGEQVAGWINNIPEGSFPGIPAHSFALEMGRNIARETGIVPLLVPCAIGSTTLSKWQPPIGNLDYTTLFGALILRARTAQANGRLPIFCWYGHEGNAVSYGESLSTGTVGISYDPYWRSLVNNVRDYFPTAPFLFAQLSAVNDAALATKLRATGENQRRSESLGATTIETPVAVGTITGSNAMTTVSGDVITMVSNGSSTYAALGAVLTIGQLYRIRMTVRGTGRVKLSSGSDGSDISDGRWDWIFIAGTTSVQIHRYLAGEPTNLTISGLSIAALSSYGIDNTHMVVTHDLPRNASPDDMHVSAVGQRELGRRFSLAYQQRVLKYSDVDGTGPRLVSVTSTDSTHTKVKFTQPLAAAKAGETNYGDGTNSLFRVYDSGAEKSVSTVAIDGGDPAAVIITHASCAGVRVVTYGDRAGQDAAWRKGVVYNTAVNPLPAPMFGPVVSA